MSGKAISLMNAFAALLVLTPAFGAGPTFHPDWTFEGSSLVGWHTLGAAEWSAEDGELVGTAKHGGDGGWLILDRSFQDVGVYATFRCTAGAETGVLLRAEKTPQGMKGVFFSLNEGDSEPYRVTLDSQGRIVEREALRRAGGTRRFAPPPTSGAPGRGSGGGRGGGGAESTHPALPISPPERGLRPANWNEFEILLDANVVRAFFNDAVAGGGVADDALGRYGPLALYVGGSGEVRFKDVAHKDLGRKFLPAEQVSDRFRMQRLNDFHYGWSVAAADINRDGITDVVSGPYYYLGPDYTTYREIYPGVTVSPSTEYPTDCWVVHARDFTGDGWPDVLTTSHSAPGNAILYVNPGKELRRWDKYEVVSALRTEITLLWDMDGDAESELVYAADGRMCYAEPDPANPTGPWIVHSVSESGVATAHGVGAGDVNGDGRMDILNAFGWYEQPAAGSRQELWTYHPVAFGRWTRGSPGGGALSVYDANGDGLSDVVTSLQAHGVGLAWYEQKRDADGKISFVQHMIMDDYTTDNAGDVTFSQIHGSTTADVDGDGIEDFVVGKRYWSHLDNYHDPDPYGPPVLYWYRTVRNPNAPGGAEFVPELIHNRSGVGSDVLASDVNQDGVIDVVTATNRGVYVFWGKP